MDESFGNTQLVLETWLLAKSLLQEIYQSICICYDLIVSFSLKN